MRICISVCDSATPRLKARLYLSSPTEVCVCVCLLFFCQRNGSMSQVQWSCECAGSPLAGLSVGLCVYEWSSWSCGLCIIDSVAHGKAPLPHHHPSSPPLFHKHASAHGWGKRSEEVAKGGRKGGGEVKGGGACRFMIIPKQMLLLKTLWIANRAACQESRNQNTSLLREVDERREGVRWGSCFPAFVSTPAVKTFLPHTILYPRWSWQPQLAEGV